MSLQKITLICCSILMGKKDKHFWIYNINKVFDRSFIMFIGTSKEKFFYHNTLLCLVKALQDQNITLDLLNDSYICGQVVTVDGYMNISFSNAVYCDPQGNEYFFEDLFVHGRNIRYVHIPENKSVLSTIRAELNKSKKQREPKKKPAEKSRKAKKALQQHLQTVASLDTDTGT